MMNQGIVKQITDLFDQNANPVDIVAKLKSEKLAVDINTVNAVLIWHLSDAGESAKDISEKLSLAEDDVRTVLNEQRPLVKPQADNAPDTVKSPETSVTELPPATVLSEKEREEIRKMVEADEPKESLAIRYGISVAEIESIIASQPAKPTTEPPLPETPITETSTTDQPTPETPATEDEGADDQPKTGWKKWKTRIIWGLGIIVVAAIILILVIPFKHSLPPPLQPLVVSITDVNSGNPLANSYLYNGMGQLLGRSQNTGEIQLPFGTDLTQQFKVEKENYLPLQSSLPQNNCFKLSRVTAMLHYTSFKPFTMVFQGEGFTKIISDDTQGSGDVNIPINTWVTVVIKIGMPNQWHRANIFLNSSQDDIIVDITERHEQHDGESITIIRSQWSVNGQSPNTQIILPYGSYIIETEFAAN